MSDDLFGDVFALPSTSRSASSPSDEASFSFGDDRPFGGEPRESAAPSGGASSTSLIDSHAGAGDLRLVDAVRELRAGQRRVEALVQRAQRRIDAAERASLFEAVGLDGIDRFVERTLPDGSLLRVLLGRARRDVKGRSAARKSAGRASRRPRAPAREPSADAAFARACAFVAALREIDRDLRDELRAIAALLRSIEEEQIFREASYDSYEDFLDRAIGPSPVLGPTLLILGDELPASLPPADAPARVTGIPGEPFDFLGSLPPAEPPEPMAPSLQPNASGASSAEPAEVRVSVARRAPTALALVASALVAVAVGTLVGLLSEPRGRAHAATAEAAIAGEGAQHEAGAATSASIAPSCGASATDATHAPKSADDRLDAHVAQGAPVAARSDRPSRAPWTAPSVSPIPGFHLASQ